MTHPASTGLTTYSTPSDRELRYVRIVKAPRALVFDVFTNPKHLPQWMTGPDGWTMAVCEADLRAGGAWRYVWRRANATEMSMTGSFREVAPPERVVTVESWGPQWPDTVNTTLFTEDDAGYTTIATTILYPSKDARDAAMQSGMKEGMDHSLLKLDRLLASLT